MAGIITGARGGVQYPAPAPARDVRVYDWRDVFVLTALAFWIGFGLAVTLIAFGVLPHPTL